MSSPVDAFRAHREKLKLVGYFVLLIVLTSVLSGMYARAWTEGGIVRLLFDARYMVGLSLDAISLVFFGVFLGLLLMMTLDSKKRLQAVLLWIGTLIALAGLAARGLFIPNIQFVTYGAWLVGGLVFGVILGGGRQLTTSSSGEFRSASILLFWMLTVLSVVALVEAHVTYPLGIDITGSGEVVRVPTTSSITLDRGGLVTHAAASLLFVGTLRKFVTYDAEEDFFVIGPRESGKSLFLVGSYLESQESSKRSSTSMASGDLMSLVEEHQRQTDEGWVLGSTQVNEVQNLEFTYVHGEIFPKNVVMSTIDYGGENVEEIPDALAGTMDSMTNAMTRIVENIRQADTLVCLVDCEQFLSGEPLDVDVYFDILRAVDDDKGLLLVATKADYLAEEFEDERGLDPHLYPEDFQEYTNNRLRKRASIDSLLDTAIDSQVYPVYYQTKELESGERVPIRDADGRVERVGFQEVLNRLGEL